jgi:UDP-MurNAc hydroxylase
MNIQLVGHACVVVETSGTSILMDPWFSGKIFNDSWTLRPEPQFDPSLLEKIDYLWISHEHPDHCHFPTLNSFPASFKQRVTLLFQERDHEKMIAAFKSLGYQNFQLLPHRIIAPLAGSSGDPGRAKVYCYHAGLMDSALAVIDDDNVVLNANDARISTAECEMIRRDLRKVDVLMSQFSLAAYAGFDPPEPHLSARAAQILDNLSTVHNALKVTATIPFASFIYFSSDDNKYVNRFANTVQDAYDHLSREKQTCVVLYPGDSYQVGAPHDASMALRRYNALPTLDELPYTQSPQKRLEEIFDAYHAMVAQLHDHYPKVVLSLLGPISVRVPDLNKMIRFRLATDVIEELSVTTPPDLVINSQPLWFGFKFPFGIQTLGVSARFKLLRNFRSWKLHRLLLSLNNGGVYLKPKYLFTPGFIAYLRSRIPGGLTQALHYYRTSL